LNRPNIRFLMLQLAAIAVICYPALVGSSTLGLILYDLRLLNLIFIAATAAVWLITWRRQGLAFPRTRLDTAWLLFVLIQCTATALSTDPRRGAVPLTLTIIYWLTFYMAVDLLRRAGTRDMLIGALLIAGAILIVFGVVQLAAWYRSWWLIGGREHLIPPATVRIQLVASHPNLLAAYLNVLLPFGIAAWVKTKARAARAALTLWLALMLPVLLFTSSRGGWIGAAAALTVLAVLFALDQRTHLADRWRYLWRNRPMYLAAGGLLLAAALVASGLVLVRQAQHPTHGPLFSARQSIWEPVWKTFMQHPLWGSGPATYATQAMQTHSIPPCPFYIHAHSFFLNTLLESGLMGLLALGGLGFASARSIVAQWRSITPGGRAWLIGAVAALTATLMHSLFETPQILPGFSLLIVSSLALIESFSLPTPRPAWLERSSSIALGLSWPALIIVLAASLINYSVYARGINLANHGRFDEATELLDQAAARDPTLATNWFQAGYAHAALGLEKNDPDHLRQAVQAYQNGLSLEPNFAINWLNMGVLLWQLGNEQDARQALQSAVDRAPQEATFALTLGAFEEATGNQTRAMDLYRQGLDARPEWADSAFFRATPLRIQAREHWLASSRRSLPIEPLRACWDALHAQQLALARQCFADARTLNDPEPYYGLGMTELAANNPIQAEWNLRAAVWISEQAPIPNSRLYFALGDVLARQDNLTGAIRQYEKALEAINLPGPMGGTAGVTTSYTWLVFNREAIIDHLFPGTVWITITDEAASRMLQLGIWYEQSKAQDKAVRMYRSLVQAVPDMQQARERLRALEAAQP